MVLNIGKLKDKDYHYVHKDIHHVVHAGSDGKQRVVKARIFYTEAALAHYRLTLYCRIR